jgi:murein endopeptidase
MRRRSLLATIALAVAVLVAVPAADTQRGQAAPRATATFAPAPPEDDGQFAVEGDPDPPIAYRASKALGMPWNGRLQRGVQLPSEGRDFFTWDPILKRTPDRGWRRWGTDSLVRTLLSVLREFRAAHPEAARVGVGDIAREHGGHFGREFGGLGHASHQNGLDVDVYYPRFDGLERRAQTPDLVDEYLAQDLVNRFVAAGAAHIYVGPHLDLHGRRGVVSKLVYHDDHLHVRLPQPPE